LCAARHLDDEVLERWSQCNVPGSFCRHDLGTIGATNNVVVRNETGVTMELATRDQVDEVTAFLAVDQHDLVAPREGVHEIGCRTQVGSTSMIAWSVRT